MAEWTKTRAVPNPFLVTALPLVSWDVDSLKSSEALTRKYLNPILLADWKIFSYFYSKYFWGVSQEWHLLILLISTSCLTLLRLSLAVQIPLAQTLFGVGHGGAQRRRYVCRTCGPIQAASAAKISLSLQRESTHSKVSVELTRIKNVMK